MIRSRAAPKKGTRAGRYSDWAQQVEAAWPSIGRVLRQLAGSYEWEARRHDEEAEALSDQD